MNEKVSSNQYWLSREGAQYQQQQVLRSAEGHASYRGQEEWLQRYFAQRSSELGRKLRVLDFGCGFGRFARLLADSEAVEYYGYDFSSKMAEPLLADPPAALQPIARRVRIAPSLPEAYPEPMFDVIFTVSVLIHNPPEGAKRLVEDMQRTLAPDGRIVLIENPLSALSFRENSWHAGCWVHDVAGTMAPQLSAQIHAEVFDLHAIYVLSAIADGARELSLHDAQGGLRRVSLDELRLTGLSRVAAGLHAVEAQIAQDADAVGRLHDEAEDAHHRHHAEVETLRGSLAAAERRAQALESGVALRSELRAAMASARTDLLEPRKAPVDPKLAHTPAQTSTAPRFAFDEARDEIFAHRDARFGRVAQVFHMEWFGIRAASGTLPGAKLAISSINALTPTELEEIVVTCRQRGIDKLVLHGMSENMYAFAVAMKRVGLQIFAVWHGTAAMWCFEPERNYFQLIGKLLANGTLTRFNAIRAGMQVALDGPQYPKQLLNPVPNYRVTRTGARRSASAIAFCPSWNLIHKNLGTNLAAAGASSLVGEVWVLASDVGSIVGSNTSVKRLPQLGRVEMIQTLSAADVALNVSVIDCHPMVDLEALAAGTPCLRGPLFLDALDEHPYVRATEVANPLSIDQIRERLDQVLAHPQAEMDAMMDDYAGQLSTLALNRYAEFLEL